MTEIILYPTETLYGLGVNPFDKMAVAQLYKLKMRPAEKAMSWLVRDVSDIEMYAELDKVGAKIAAQFLPGPLTLVLPLRREYWSESEQSETIGFRVSSDPVAQAFIADFMDEHRAPLTCTSANISNYPTLATVPEILAQFGEKQTLITTIIDAGPRASQPSTVIEIKNDKVICLREGVYSWEEIDIFLSKQIF